MSAHSFMRKAGSWSEGEALIPVSFSIARISDSLVGVKEERGDEVGERNWSWLHAESTWNVWEV